MVGCGQRQLVMVMVDRWQAVNRAASSDGLCAAQADLDVHPIRLLVLGPL